MAAKPRRVAVDYAVFLAVRLAALFLQSLPIELAGKLADALAYAAWRLDRRHREVARRNVAAAFPDLPAERHDAIVRETYRHFAQVAVEIAHIPRKLHVSNWKRRARLENVAPALDALLSDRPTLVVTGHFGNWEMAGFLVAAIGVRSFAIARDLDNPFLHRFLLRFREFTGQTILSKTKDYDRICQVLAEGKTLISVGDQSAGPRGHFVDFFGRPASTHKAIALLALQYDARVLVGYGRRRGQGLDYVVGCSRVLDPRDYADRPDGALALTQDFTLLLEDSVRKAPEQYFWLHNRWKHEPPGKARRTAAARAA